MTSKDYKKVAAILAGAMATRTATHDTDKAFSARVTIEGIAYSLADWFAQDNPRFDRDKFYAAAGVDRSRFDCWKVGTLPKP